MFVHARIGFGVLAGVLDRISCIERIALPLVNEGLAIIRIVSEAVGNGEQFARQASAVLIVGIELV